MAGVPNPLAIFGELRTQFKSMKERYEKYKEGPHKFQSLAGKFDVLVRHLDDMESLLRMFPNALPTAGATLFQENLARLRDSFKEEQAAMPPRLTLTFGGSSTRSTVPRRVLRAKSLDDEMTDLLKKIEAARNQLEHLVIGLLTALKVDELVTPKAEIEANYNRVMSMLYKVDERLTSTTVSRAHHDAVMSMLSNLSTHIMHLTQANREENRKEETSKKEYCPSSNIPDLGGSAILDFSPTTSLGQLKQSVMYGGSSKTVTAATAAVEPTAIGSSYPAYSVLGMAGVGKTVALQALGHDEDVKRKFQDGVLYMTFGRYATLETAIGQIAKIMTLTGATAIVQEVRSSTSLRDAVDYAAMWFRGKVCLYLIDALWPAKYLPAGYFEDIRQLLRGSPRSRMAISTRCSAIAAEAGSIIEFGPLDPLGNTSTAIFLAHAGRSSPPFSPTSAHTLRHSFSKILSICSGLPIALSVTGSAVAKHIRRHGTFEKACDAYAVKLEEKRTLLGDKKTAGGTSLNAGIMLSLESLEDEFSDLVAEQSLNIDHSVTEIYSSLCVLSNQTWVPVSVLGVMWKIDKDGAFDAVDLFCGMSLAKLERRRPSRGLAEESGIVLHDLLLDFCQQQAESSKTKKMSYWHTQLLNGYPKTTNQPVAEDPSKQIADAIMSCVPRPWWSNAVPEDGYIHANLARHLSGAGQGVELAALLLDARWTEVRARIGGILSLKSDFAHLGSYLSQWESSAEVLPSIRNVKESFENIFKAVRLSWGRRPEGMTAFQFQVCGRLQSARESNATVDEYLNDPKSIVDAYLKSLVMTTPKPSLVPVNAFLSLGGAQIMEIPVGGACASVASSPCGEYIAAGAGRDIAIVKASTGEVLQRMRGHTDDLSCVKFATGSKKLVSGSRDEKVMVWEWESSSSPMRVLPAPHFVSGLAVDIDIFFSTKFGLRAWDLETPDQSRKVYTINFDELVCLAVSGKNRQLALGTLFGELIVLDIDTNAVVFSNRKAHKTFVTCGAFCPNGQYLATGSMDDTIRVWNASSWTRCRSLRGHEYSVRSVCFSPDGARIASASEDGTIRVWDFVSGECLGRSPKIPTLMTSVSFTSEGTRIISGSDDGIIRIWDACLTRESEEQNFGHTGAVRDVAISPNGLRVATASDDTTVRQWNAQTGEQIGVPLRGHKGAVVCVAFSPDAQRLVSGSSDETLRLWDTETCDPVGHPFERHKSAIRYVSFSSDGLRIISTSHDFTFLLWNVETQQGIGFFLEARKAHLISCVSESIDGCYIVYRDVSGRTTIRNRDNWAIVWISGRRNSMQDDEAEEIIRSCNQLTRRLWPKNFPAYTDELYCEKGRVYSNLRSEKTVIAETRGCWAYNAGRKVFASGLDSGAVAICELVI